MTEAQRMLSSKGGRISKFHILVVSLSLMLTLSAWQFSRSQIETRTGLRFDASRDSAVGLIIDRMNKYEDALWAGVAAVESHGGDISYQNWKSFADTLRIGERYPGINGIGVIHFHTEQTLDDYLVRQRVVRLGFQVFPDHDQRIFMPITFVEPEDANRAAIGLDVAHELNRRTAALASRDTGEARITGAINLVQDADQTPGFLFYAPFYRDGPPSDLTDRQNRFVGAVYAPFVVHRLMEGLLAKDLRNVRFSITDSDDLLYDEHLTSDPEHDPNPMFSENITIEFYGRSWRLDLRTDLIFRQENSSSKPTIILLAGVVIEVFIIALLVLMSRANDRAIRYADKVTMALKQETATLALTNAELSLKNDEIERFVYITSHDLKTPVRGIGGLSEMIEEDLQDYFASASANPEVSENLTLIQDRVRRMAQLTNGILEFSKIGVIYSEDEPLNIAEAIATMTFDFGLKKGQLDLSGDLEVVYADTLNFRRVLENLVGNAIKYHHDVDQLKINVTAKVDGDWCRISVADNGPGIDLKYHSKVFDIFQTLRTSDMPESTGIGLSIVKKAVERHGGKIILESWPSEGCTFDFEWPNKCSTTPSEDMRSAA